MQRWTPRQGFGTHFTQADQLAFEQIEEDLVTNEELAEQARVKSIDNYGYGFEERCAGRPATARRG
jgi:hypothetical protein